MPRTRRSQRHSKNLTDSKENNHEIVEKIKIAFTYEIKNPKTSNEGEVLVHSAREYRVLKEELENLQTKYTEKELLIKDLKKKSKEQEQKLIQQDQYIMKLKKGRKVAESVHKNNVSNLITSTAQNQALMTVLSSQQQSLQQVLPPTVFPSNTLHPMNMSSMQHNAFPHQLHPLVNLNNQPGQNFVCHGGPGYFNNMNCYGYYGSLPPNQF